MRDHPLEMASLWGLQIWGSWEGAFEIPFALPSMTHTPTPPAEGAPSAHICCFHRFAVLAGWGWGSRKEAAALLPCIRADRRRPLFRGSLSIMQIRRE